MENNENNVQNQVNEQKENKKKSNGGAIKGIIVVVLLALFLGIGFGAGMLFNGKWNTFGNKTKKVDENKDWVYDADYKMENKKLYWTSEKKKEDEVNSDEDLVVPYININSDAAKKANENIKALYEDCYSKYGTLDPLGNNSDYKVYSRYILKYEKYVNNNILSVVVTKISCAVVVDGGTGMGTYTKYTYNFNLDTLNEATLDEMAKVCGFASGDEVASKIEKWENRQEELAKKYVGFVGATMDGVQKGKYFIDSNKKMNFIYKFSAGSSGDTDEIVEPNKDIKDFYDENELIEAKKVYENAQAKNQTTTEDDQSNTTNTTATSNYATEYIKIIDEVKAEYPNTKVGCDLIYFNDDDIPDLVIEGGGISLYMFKDGKVYKLMDNEPVGQGSSKYFDYLEKKGALYNYGNSYAGAISYTTIKVLNEKNEFDKFEEIGPGADVEPSDSRYEDIQKDLAEHAGYYYNGNKISEEEFNNKLKGLSVSTNERDYKGLYGSKTADEVKKELQK